MEKSRRDAMKIGGTLTATLPIAALFAPTGAKAASDEELAYTIDTVSDFSSIPESFTTVIVKEKYRGGIFYKIAEIQTDNGTIFDGNNCSWERVYDGAVNVRWFGAKGDALTIDTNAFQSAVDTGREIFVPEGHYIIDSTIEAVTIFIQGAKSHDASVIEYTAVDGSALFKTTGYYKHCKYISFSNLKLKGKYSNGSTADCTAIKFDNDSLVTYCDDSSDGEELLYPKEDIDAYVKDCHISGFNKALHIIGRGLYVDNCIFSVSYNAVFLDRNNPINEYTEDDQKAETGARAYWIRNSRFHAMSGGSILDNTQENCELLKGILFTDNYIDSSVPILNGACRESVFSGNTHIYGDKYMSLFSSDFNWKNVIITGNNFSAIQASSTNAERENKHIILIGENTPAHVEGLTFSNNTIFRVDRESIKINALAVVNININNNIFNNVCKYAAMGASRVIDIIADVVSRCNIESNIISIANEAIKDVQDNLDYVVRFSGKVYNTTCLNNKFNESLMYIANKSAFIPNSVIQHFSILQESDIKRDDSNAAPQLLISKNIFKKSKTSYLTVRWQGIVRGNNGVKTSFPRVNLYVNGESLKKNIYVNNVTDEIKHISLVDIIKDVEVTNISIYLSDGSKTPQDFTVLANSMLTIEEIE